MPYRVRDIRIRFAHESTWRPDLAGRISRVTAVAQRLAVVCAANAEYAQPLAVMLRSLDECTERSLGIDVHVIDDGLAQVDRMRVERSVSPRVEVHWIESRWSSPEVVLPTWGRMPRTPFLKLFLGERLPAELSRVLWLDSDIVVCGDVAPLWREPLADRLLLAVRDRRVPRVSSRFGIATHAELGIAAEAAYFNSGVMLIDVAAWRANSIGAAACDYLARFRDRVVFWDQEALNVALAGRWRRLDSRWNFDPTLPQARRHEEDDEAGDADFAPVVLHFCGRLKPWIYGPMSPEHELYFSHLDQTAWSGWRPRVSLLRRLLGRYSRSALRRACYPLESAWTALARALSRRDLSGG